MRNIEPFQVVLKINFIDGCACHYVQINIPVNFKISRKCPQYDKEGIFQKLREAAAQDPQCGQHEIIERRANLSPKYDIAIYAIATNIAFYNKTPKVFSEDISSNGNTKLKTENMNCDGPATADRQLKRRKRKK